MADLLTHVLAGYVIAALLARRGVLPARHVPVVMVGALVPDLAKVYFLLGDPTVEVAGVALSWYALQTLGGVGLLVLAGTLLFERRERGVAALSLGLGAYVHVAFDLMVERAHGLAPPYFYPLTWWHPPSLDLYISADVWPSLVAIAVAAVVWYSERRFPVDERH